MPAAVMLALLIAGSMAWDVASRVEAQGCGMGINLIVCENQKPGNPKSDWDVSGSGDSTIQGFATEFSVAPGQTPVGHAITKGTRWQIS